MWKYDATIITPVYNTEKYIRECFDSILNQTYSFDKIQIILINDGSLDNGKQICEEIKNTYKNVVFIDQKNAGVSEARNAGIKKAEGKYILFLDSDDKLEKHSLQRLINFFDKHYDEIDLACYTLEVYENEKAKASEHYRYKLYNEGTGIYDLDEYPYLGQSNVNIIIKNYKENNILFDKNMSYSEDEAFNTEILMKKNKIGFCKEATYIYRKNVGSATKNHSNPYYTFESLTKYNEDLIKKYKNEDGKIPKYIQAIILNNFRWRIKSDEIFPYHYEKEEFEKAISRIKNTLSYIENGTILNMPNMPIYHQFYIFKLKNMKLDIYYGDHIFSIMNNNEVLFSSEKIEIAFNRCRIIDNKKLYILGSVQSPICELVKPKLIMKYRTKNNEIVEKQIEIRESVKSYYMSTIKTNNFYAFEEIIDLNEIERFEFYTQVNNTKLAAEYFFSSNCIFNTEFERYNVLSQDNNYLISYDEENNVFYVKSPTKKEIRLIKKQQIKLYNEINPRINVYRELAFLNKKDNIWLYYDAPNVFDNGYYQFLHDVAINDKIKRYFIYDRNNKEIKNKFNSKQRKHLIKFGSLKHRIYFLRAKKILTSDVSLSVYSPFRKSTRWYRDFANYDLIYLQHGILYANLIDMYAKENTEIDKIVISSDFEKNNLIKNYNYKENDLIMAGMPRFDINGNTKKDKNESKKIIYAPSWRKYLVGELVNRKRLPNMVEMIKSDFYKKNVEILTSEKLKSILRQNNVVLEFKLHPNFNCYRKLFAENESDVIKLSEKQITPSSYDMLITDYSSFQFDFIKYNMPIVYFVPDKKEMEAGLHTYRKLDMPLEEAFGDVVYNSNDLINKIEYYIKNNFEPESKYKEKMETFFYDNKNCRDKIYENLIG